MSPLVLDWTLSNLIQDEEDEFVKIRNVINVLKPWLNTRLYLEERKAEEKKSDLAQQDVFWEDLKKRGVDRQSVEQNSSLGVDLLEKEMEDILEGK